ncbi:ADP-ribosylglycohydrolase family protein [Achromobacter xylosoxidans]|uniref:ADP-ribosylglycohydrolase n=1 Tax=Alcaligenes xylosoxydans xylosoxydans TaxID=85698 RepID=A0A2L0PTV6_ALCXX|nr:ADP-ribosylglycohydrolase family protein [Achromobacter xylosoxidans]AUZ18144.1 ADP-ribosylglycohydrolase [Achromobacter xylosoxidans]
MTIARHNRTISSALWAAYGDALGFPTELADVARIEERVGARKVSKLVPWTRQVGGRFGSLVELPEGAYSDDTQLRLCVSRAIRADGYFDVEAFSKVELPVWLSYALGAGRGSKAAATALGQRTVAWFSNFFNNRDSDYLQGGGNGAAMRIQPHVWAARDLFDERAILVNVVRNAICTHGHPRGIAGAAIHAYCLIGLMRGNAVHDPEDWESLGDAAAWCGDFVEGDPDLSSFWLPTWEIRTGQDFRAAMTQVREEWIRDIVQAKRHLTENRGKSYLKVVSELDGLASDQRGSGLKSSLFSLVLAWLYKDASPADAILAAANVPFSDTDTISSMAGALLGALNPDYELPANVQDFEYVKSEASRLYSISAGENVKNFSYPDLLAWSPPRTQLDAVGYVDGKTALAGLGALVEIGEPIPSGKEDVVWQWYKTEFGQSIVCKRRKNLNNLYKMNHLSVAYGRLQSEAGAKLNDSNVHSIERGLFDDLEHPPEHSSREALTPKLNAKEHWRSVDELSDDAIKSGFDAQLIGRHILLLSERSSGVELVVAYSAIIAKARIARLRRE